MSRISLITMVTAVLLPAAYLRAASPQEVQGIKVRQQGLKVIEEKCLFCHNRQRIDQAIKERQNMEKIMRQMQKRGVTLTEKEHRVIGHFWQQNPLKSEDDQQKRKTVLPKK